MVDEALKSEKAPVQHRSWCVEWFGSQGDFIAGKAMEPISLERFANLNGLYAVGPLEQGRGEVSIFNSMALISKFENGVVRIDQGFCHRAGFLVYGSIENWGDATILRPGNSEEDLTEQLLTLAVSNGIADDAPFPFLIHGRIDHAKLHVLCNQSNGKYGPELHEKGKVRFEIEQESVEIIGFYSRHHHGIFTPRDSDLHMHIRTWDNRLAGHVESIRWGQLMSMSVPEVENSFSYL